MKKLLFLILIVPILLTCERDDICPESTPTTPRLFISFYDLADQTTAKKVSKLTVVGDDNDEVLKVVVNGTTITYNGASSYSDVYLPLKTDTDVTTYILYKNSTIDENDVISGNPDTLTFNYTRNDVYVSRACGYKTTFTNLFATLKTDTDNWILSAPNLEPITVENETEAHLKIYH